MSLPFSLLFFDFFLVLFDIKAVEDTRDICAVFGRIIRNKMEIRNAGAFYAGIYLMFDKAICIVESLNCFLCFIPFLPAS